MKQKKNKVTFSIDEVNCFKCRKQIRKDKERYVSLSTYKGTELIEQVNFHIQCWGDYNQQRINDRLSEMANVGLTMLKSSNIITN